MHLGNEVSAELEANLAKLGAAVARREARRANFGKARVVAPARPVVPKPLPNLLALEKVANAAYDAWQRADDLGLATVTLQETYENARTELLHAQQQEDSRLERIFLHGSKEALLQECEPA